MSAVVETYDILRFITPHCDNTGLNCRISLKGHDCCSVCNLAQDLLDALVDHREGDWLHENK